MTENQFEIAVKNRSIRNELNSLLISLRNKYEFIDIKSDSVKVNLRSYPDILIDLSKSIQKKIDFLDQEFEGL